MIKATDIVLSDIRKLKLNPKNRNKHPKEQIERLQKLIEYQGFRNPIIVSNQSGFVVVGHGRIEAAKNLGIKEVPVIYQDFDDETQEQAYLISDNAIASWAELDLSEINVDIQDMGPDFDIDLLGIKGFEIDVADKELGDEEDTPEPPKESKVVKGEVYILGDHRLMCGDSTMIDDVEKLMNGQKPNTMITDPPYGVKYEAGWRAEAKNTKKTDREISSNLKNDDNADWYDAYVLHPGNIAYVWHASAFTDVVMEGLRKANFEIKAQIIWNKNVHALSRSDYQWKHEPCWYAVKSGANHNWLGDRKQKTVWDIQNVMFEKDGGGKTSHPTQKPVELYCISIKNHTNPGEYIYEPFGGSGTSIIAAEKNSRRSITMELDPIYCAVILDRWEKYTGRKAIREDGKLWEEIKNG